MEIEQGGIYRAEFAPAVGHDQQERGPALMLSEDTINRLPFMVLVPPGLPAERYPARRRYPSALFVPVAASGLPQDPVFLGLQLRSLDSSRIGSRLGRPSANRIAEARDVVPDLLRNDRKLR